MPDQSKVTLGRKSVKSGVYRKRQKWETAEELSQIHSLHCLLLKTRKLIYMTIRNLLFKLRLLTEEAMSEERRHQAGRCCNRSRIINSHDRVLSGTERGRSRRLNEVHQSVSLKNTLRSLSESVVSDVNF